MSESADIMLDVAKKSENIAPDLFFTHNGNENDEDELELIKIELYSDFEDEDGKSNDKNSLEKDPNSNSQILDQFKNPRTKVPMEIRKQIVGKFYSVIIVILSPEKKKFLELYKEGKNCVAISKIVNWQVGTVRYIVKKYKIYGTVEDRTTGPRTQKTGPISKDILSPRIQKLANQRDDPNIDPKIAETQTASNHYGKHFTSGGISN